MKKALITAGLTTFFALTLTACGKKEPPKPAQSQQASSVETPTITPVKIAKLSKNYHPGYVEGLCTYSSSAGEILYFKNPNSVVMNLNGKDVVLKNQVKAKGNLIGQFEHDGNTLTLNIAGKGTYSEGIGSKTPLLLKITAGDNTQNISLVEKCSD